MRGNKKYIVLITIFLLLNIGLASNVFSQEIGIDDTAEEIEIHYFWMEGCSACINQERFNERLLEEYPEVKINRYRMYPPEEGAWEKWEELSEKYDIESLVTPTTIIDGNVFENYYPPIGYEIEKIVAEKLNREMVNITEGEDMFTIPLIGISFDPTGLSLPLLSVALGTFDGFNVCSIGALLLVLSIVIKFDSRKKILIYGGLFLLTTAFVYGLLAFFWRGMMKLFEAHIGSLSVLIGVAAIGGGIYFFKDFIRFYKYGPTCETSSTEFVNNIQNKVKNILLDKKKGIIATIGVIILFATAITIIELPCSIGLPLVFTGILTDAGVSTAVFASYVALYMLMYLLIELIIFIGAVYTKSLWYGPDKAVTWMTLAASLVLLGLGFYYIYPYLPL